MKTRTPLTVLLILVAALFAAPAGPLAQSADEVLLKQAINLEKAKGDIKGATEIYKRLATSQDAKVAALAKVELTRLLGKPGQSSLAAVPEEFGQLLDVQPENYMTFSPDGRLLGRLRRAGSRDYREPSLVVVDLQSGQDTLLATLRGNTRATAFSPDGKWLAAQVGGIQAVPRALELVVAPVSGTGPVISIPDLGARPEWPVNANTGVSVVRNWLVWSPDSRWLPFVAPTDTAGVVEARLLDVTTGRHESLNLQTDQPAEFQWSPSGTELAMHVSSAAKGIDEIRIINPTTRVSRATPLPATPGAVKRLGRWTTKGQFVVYRQNESKLHDTLLFDPATQVLTKTCTSRVPYTAADGFPEGLGDLCREFSRDGSRQLTWKFDAKRLMVRDTNTGAEQPLTSGGGEERAAFLAPDGRHVVFISNRDGEWGLYSSAIDTAPNPKPARLARFAVPPIGVTPHWTRTGVVMDYEFDDSNIMRVPAPGKERTNSAPERLTQDRVFNSKPSTHGDTGKVAYWSSNGGAWAVSVMDSDGSRERVLSEVIQAIVEEPPVWRSAEQVLVARLDGVWTGTGIARFISVDVRTGDQTPHGTVDLDGRRWDFVHRTQEVIYRGTPANGGAHTLRAYSLSTGEDREFARLDQPGSTLNSFTVSPDGSRVAYQAVTPRGLRAGILVPGGAPADFPTGAVNVIPVAWSRDGRYLLGNAGQPVIVEVATGAMTPVLDSTQKIDWTGEAAWSADGSFIFLTVSAHKDEWRLYPNVAGGGR